MKTKLAIFCSLAMMLGMSVTAQPVIHSPTNNQVLYVGDIVDIKWTPRQGSAKTVTIGLQANVSGTMGWIAFAVTNSGTFTWTVGKWATSLTNFTLSISDGGNVKNTSNVLVFIPNGPRPPEPVRVPIAIRKVVSVEWVANTNHDYRVDVSQGLNAWVTVTTVRPQYTNAVALFYSEQGSQYFRVYDLTP